MKKNAFAMFGHFHLARGLLAMELLLSALLLPPAMLLLPAGWLWGVPLLAYASMVGSGLYIYRKVGAAPWPVLARGSGLA